MAEANHERERDYGGGHTSLSICPIWWVALSWKDIVVDREVLIGIKSSGDFLLE